VLISIERRGREIPVTGRGYGMGSGKISLFVFQPKKKDRGINCVMARAPGRVLARARKKAKAECLRQEVGNIGTVGTGSATRDAIVALGHSVLI
jgi:hypothetical protein